jgi:ADP-heptose:LPS heptosyltransferase
LRQVVATQYSHAYVFEADPRYHHRLKNSAHSVHLLQSSLPMLHYCERCLSLVEKSVTKPVHRGWVRLPLQAQGRRRALLQLREHGFQEGACLIGFHATSSSDRAPMFRKMNVRRHRSWPAESFAQLARLLLEHAADSQYHLQIVMDALPEEVELVEAIVKESNGAIRLMAGTPDFERYKAVLEQMALLVTPDTGPMHIAAAVGTPLVALFSRKSPEDCGPYVSADKYAILRAEDSSNPEVGLAGITPESVFRACLRFLPPAGKDFVTADGRR